MFLLILKTTQKKTKQIKIYIKKTSTINKRWLPIADKTSN